MQGDNFMFRQFFSRLSASMQRFMAGRYGTDRLNMTILSVGLVACLISAFIQAPVLNLILTAISYALMFWAIYRTMSRQTYKRYLENRKFMQFIDRFKDREHRYYDCPKCRQSVRVPRGKGKIAITCPRCREKFVRKT